MLEPALKRMLVDRGARLVGIASIDRFEGAPKGHHPVDFIANAQSVVVIGLPIVRGLMGWNTYMAGSERLPMESAYTDGNGNQKVWSPLTNVRKHIERRCSYEVINMQTIPPLCFGHSSRDSIGHFKPRIGWQCVGVRPGCSTTGPCSYPSLSGG